MYLEHVLDLAVPADERVAVGADRDWPVDLAGNRGANATADGSVDDRCQQPPNGQRSPIDEPTVNPTADTTITPLLGA